MPIEVKRILCAGPKFSIPISFNEIPLPTIIKDLEYCLLNINLSEDDKQNLRAKSINCLTNYYFRMKNCNHYSEIRRDFNLTKKFLNINKNLIVSRSDKGNSTVIMEKDEYCRGMNILLEDDNTYRLLNNNPTNVYQQRSNDLINELKENGIISETDSRNMKSYNSVPPKLYGLRKTHKADLSMRPVVSCINAPSYKLARFIHNLLFPLTTTFHINVKNSFEFVEFTKTVKLKEGYVLVSLDVVSLFTNIPKEFVLKILKKNWRFMSAYTDISYVLLSRIIEFLFESSYFSFNNVIYQQLDGSAMGNPASPVMSNLIMYDLVTECCKKLPFQLDFIKIYVDDTILSVPENMINEVLNIFNSYHPKLQFTCEREKDNCISFLDTLIMRQHDGTLLTNWYSKPTSSGRILNFLSNHPWKHKLSTIKNLLYRAHSLSSPIFFIENNNKIKELLKKNNYPTQLVNKYINEFNQTTPEKIKQDKIFYKFPYIKGLSEKIRGCLKKKEEQLELSFYPINKVQSIFSTLKDKHPLTEESNIVYKINCIDCDKCYIGITKQYLKTRIYQHQYDCREKNRTKKEKTALAQHHFTDGHNFNFERPQILEREYNYRKRTISEMIHIKLNDTINSRTDVAKLSSQYNYLLNAYKESKTNRTRFTPK